MKKAAQSGRLSSGAWPYTGQLESETGPTVSDKIVSEPNVKQIASTVPVNPSETVQPAMSTSRLLTHSAAGGKQPCLGCLRGLL
jgi:hypothetical protein